MKYDFLNYLKEELLRRQKLNPQYSLRAMARDLGIEASLLSKILRRKVPLTQKMLERLAPILGLSIDHVDHGERGIEKVKHVSKDDFEHVKDWYYGIIPHLSKLSDFSKERSYIAAKLGISEEEAEEAMKNIMDLGDGDTDVLLIPKDLKASEEALQERYLQMLDKSIRISKNKEKVISHHISGVVDAAHLDEIEEKIKKFTRELMAKYEAKSSDKNQVVEMLISVFPVSKK